MNIADHVRHQAGLDAEASSAAVYLPLTISTNLVSLVLGVCVVDRLSTISRVRCVALAYAILALTMLISIHMPSVALVRLFGVTLGVYEGSAMALYNVIFASLFGRRHLGKIRGVAVGVGIFLTGLGPLVFSLCRDRTGNYDDVVWVLFAVQCVTATALFVVPACTTLRTTT